MLTIKGNLGELRDFCETHVDEYENYNMKVKGYGLPKMSGEDMSSFIEDVVNDALNHLYEAFVDFLMDGGTLLESTSNEHLRSCVAVIRGKDRTCYFGVAICAPHDHFNTELGIHLAIARALDSWAQANGGDHYLEEMIMEFM